MSDRKNSLVVKSLKGEATLVVENVSGEVVLTEVLGNLLSAYLNKDGQMDMADKKEILAGLKILGDKVNEVKANVLKAPVVVERADEIEIKDGTNIANLKPKKKTETLTKAGMSTNGKPKTIGFFGITANPPHVSHCSVIKDALKHFDEVWVSPVFIHPSGKKTIPYENRLELLELIIEDFFEDLSDLRRVKIVEVDKEFCEKFETLPFSYDLLNYMQELFPKNSYALVIGEDNYAPEVWQKFHKYREIEENFQVFVSKEAGVHSTQIRESFKDFDEEALAMFCLPQAARYLKKHNFW